MLKSELLNYLQESIAKHGDGEIKVEVTSNLNFLGKIYPITDVVYYTGSDIEGEFIECLIGEEEKT